MPVKEYSPEELNAAALPDHAEEKSDAVPVPPGNAFTSGTPIATFRANVTQAQQPLDASQRMQMSTGDRVIHGVKQGLADTIGQAVAHPLDTVKGVAGGLRDLVVHGTPYDPENPLAKISKSIFQDVNDNGPAEAIPHALAQGVGGWAMGEAGGAALRPITSGASKLMDAVPRTGRAGSSFESLNADLANHPVPLKATLKPLQRVTEIGERGSSLPTAVDKLLKRSQMTEPMTFPEARDYQSSLSDLSASDKMAMNGRVRGGVAQVNKALFQDIKDAAASAGREEDYAKAMKEYRQASQIKSTAKTAGKLALKGAGVYGGYTALKDLAGK